MATQSPAEANKDLVRRFNEEVVNGKNYDVIAETNASDFVQHGAPGTEGDVAGLEDVESYLRELHEAFPDLTATIEDIVAEDDVVATRLTYTGTHEGEFMGIEPTGVEATVDGMVFNRIEDGKAAEAWVQVDAIGLLDQLGA